MPLGELEHRTANE